jgi:hypothetical protein
VEVVAVDDARGGDAGVAQGLLPVRVLVDGGAPRDVVDGPRALAAGLRRRLVVGDGPAADLAAQLPRVVPQRRGAEEPLEQDAAVLRLRAVSDDPVEAL